jgi:hypothetical protein
MGRDKDAPHNLLYADFRIADRSGVGFQFTMIKWIHETNRCQSVFCTPYYFRLLLKQYLSFGISYNYNNFKIDIDSSIDFENQF